MDYADDDLALGVLGYPEQSDELYLISPLPPAEFRLDYGNDWIAFAEEVLKVERTPEQIRLNLPWYTPDQKRIAETVLSRKYTLVLSGNGVGKTFIMAILVLLLYYRGFTVITTAPTMRQVHQLWAEIRTRKIESERLTGKSLPGDWKPSEEHVKDPLTPKHALYGFAAQVGAGEAVATSFQGKHHTRMAVFVDEGIGVQKAVFEAIDTVVVNEYPDGVVAVFGNPTEEGSHAHTLESIKDQTTGLPIWTTINVNGENHPNVVHNNAKIIPGAVTRSFVELQKAKGGGVESAYYRTSVLGQWPGQKKDALILSDWIEKSMRRAELRNEDDRNGIERIRDARGVALGLDVAGEGDNLTVLTACEDFKLFWPKLSRPCWHIGKDHQAAVDLLICAIKEIPRVLSISIDDTGIGAEVSASLWRRRNEFPDIPIYITKGPRADPSAIWQKVSITRINFGASPLDEFDQDRLARMRDVLWWRFREDLRDDRGKRGILLLPTATEQRAVGFPPDADLKAQVMNPLMWKDDRGKIHVVDKASVKDVPKEVAKKLPNISPDLAHSAMLAWWAWRELAERQAAPKTTEQHFETQFRAQIERTVNQTRRDDGLTPQNVPAIFRRAR